MKTYYLLPREDIKFLYRLKANPIAVIISTGQISRSIPLTKLTNPGKYRKTNENIIAKDKVFLKQEKIFKIRLPSTMVFIFMQSNE